MPANAFGDEVETNGFGDPVEHDSASPKFAPPDVEGIIRKAHTDAG